MKYLGEANMILDKKITQISKNTDLNISYSIKKCWRNLTIIITNLYVFYTIQVSYERKILEKQLKYSQLIELLLYTLNTARSDKAFIVDKLSRYTSNHSKKYWTTLERIFKYLNRTISHNLPYKFRCSWRI